MAFWSDSPNWNTTGVRDAGQALITAAKDDGEGVRRHKERQQADSEARNNHFFGSLLYVAGQDHHGFAKRHLQYKGYKFRNDFLVLKMALKTIFFTPSQPYRLQTFYISDLEDKEVTLA